MAIYNVYICVVTLFIVQSYGNGQIVTKEIRCDYSSSTYNNCTGVHRNLVLGCNPHYVIMITNITVGYYNETEERTCCQRIPENICTVDVIEEIDFGYFYPIIADSCFLSRTCVISTSYLSYYRIENCTSANFLAYFEYLCVSNSSFINMTKPGIHHNFNSFSLFYESYLEVEKHFYCSCEITADDDVYIYTRVDSILLIGMHNTSVKIYSQDHTVRYDVDHTDHNGYKYLIYKQLKQTKGPIYLVYEGDELNPIDDKISINFKVSQGLLKANCTGCQTGYSSPPIFGPRTTDSKGSMDSTTPGQPTSSSSDIYKTALISVLVIIAVLGLVMVVGVVVYRKRKCTKNKKDTAKDVATTSRPVSGTVYEIPLSRTVSNISESGSELYDTIHEQPTK